MRLLKTKGSIVGIDIGPEEIRVVEGAVEASIPTPEGAVLDGVIINVKGIVGVLKDLIGSTKGITGKNAIMAVSGKA